jgi:chromosome segregation ATPase
MDLFNEQGDTPKTAAAGGVEAAKQRLEKALNRLEMAANNRMRQAQVRLAQAEEGDSTNVRELRTKLSEAQEQVKHLREEGEKLRTLLGQEKEKTETVQATTQKVSKRLDEVILSMQQVLKRQGV